jgi:hypothetical protein
MNRSGGGEGSTRLEERRGGCRAAGREEGSERWFHPVLVMMRRGRGGGIWLVLLLLAQWIELKKLNSLAPQEWVRVVGRGIKI